MLVKTVVSGAEAKPVVKFRVSRNIIIKQTVIFCICLCNTALLTTLVTGREIGNRSERMYRSVVLDHVRTMSQVLCLAHEN